MATGKNGIDDIFFGQIAVSRGMVSKSRLLEVIEIQDKLKSMGLTPRRLGEILIEKNYISPSQIKEILAEQRVADSKRAIAGYEIIEKLGQGGMGAVYKARQNSMARIVALKILPKRFAKNKEFLQRFVREARASAKLNHENIISGIDVGKSNGFYYFAMEFVDGESLDKTVAREGPMNEAKALEITLQIAMALDHAKNSGLVHRDVKPQNIMLTKKGLAKLCDLGLAKNINSGKDITSADVSVGTPHYISPEQAKGENADIRSDIYSLGATLFHLVTGEVPFKGPSPMVVMTKHLTEDPPYPGNLNPSLSRGICNMIMFMMSKRPEDRFQTPNELVDAVKDLATGGRRGKSSARLKRSKSARTSAPSPRAGVPQYNVPPAPTRRPPSTRISQGRRGKSSRRTRTGEFRPGRKSRASAAQAVGKNETVFLAAGLGTILLIILALILYSSGTPGLQERLDNRHNMNDVQDCRVAADEKLREAQAYENQNPYEYNNSIAMYQNVIRHYSNTAAAEEARIAIRRIKNNPTYRSDR